MHYPPQQPMSNFGLPSQQPPIPIVAHFRRPRMILNALIFVGLLALFGVLLWFLSHPSPLPVALYACGGLFILYCLRFISSIVHALVLHQPALIITSVGIQILTTHGAGRCRISWPEIALQPHFETEQ